MKAKLLRLTAFVCVWLLTLMVSPLSFSAPNFCDDCGYHNESAYHSTICGGSSSSSDSDDIDLGQEANKMGQGAMIAYGGAALAAGGVTLIATGQPYKGIAAIGGGILAFGTGIGKFWDGITTIHNHNN